MTKQTFQGETLQARREELALSVDDVYRKLRIPVQHIVAMEAGQSDGLPEMCYAEGFLRTYCTLLEMDPEPFIDGLRESRRPVNLFLGITEEHRTKAPWLNDLLAWAAISAILLLGWVTYAVILQPDAERAESRVQAGTVQMHLPDPPSGR